MAGQMVAVRALEAGQAALPRWTWCWRAGPARRWRAGRRGFLHSGDGAEGAASGPGGATWPPAPPYPGRHCHGQPHPPLLHQARTLPLHHQPRGGGAGDLQFCRELVVEDKTLPLRRELTEALRREAELREEVRHVIDVSDESNDAIVIDDAASKRGKMLSWRRRSGS